MTQETFVQHITHHSSSTFSGTAQVLTSTYEKTIPDQNVVMKRKSLSRQKAHEKSLQHSYRHIIKCRKCTVPEVNMTEVPMYLAGSLTSLMFRHFKTCVYRVLSIVTGLCRSHFEILT